MSKPTILNRINNTPLVVWVLIGICVGTELFLTGADWGVYGSPRWRPLAYQNGGFWIGLLGDWKPNFQWQPVTMFATYGFLHSGLTHLIVNMFTLFTLGTIIVGRIGQRRFAALYLASIVGGGVGFAILSNAPQPMVGASGALFGLMGALSAWEYVDRFTAEEKLWPVLRLVLILIAFNLILWWAMNGQLAWETHLGGFVFGWIFANLIDPRSRPIEFEDD